MKGCLTGKITRADAAAIVEAAKRSDAERKARYPDEPSAIRAVFDGFVRLKDMGWRHSMYAPRDGSPLELIEAGSTGIHRGYRDQDGHFWIVDDDTWPSNPILWRAAPPEAPHG